jgi:hypothetical protein
VIGAVGQQRQRASPTRDVQGWALCETLCVPGRVCTGGGGGKYTWGNLMQQEEGVSALDRCVCVRVCWPQTAHTGVGALRRMLRAQHTPA